jgi:hypothetical protein
VSVVSPVKGLEASATWLWPQWRRGGDPAACCSARAACLRAGSLSRGAAQAFTLLQHTQRQAIMAARQGKQKPTSRSPPTAVCDASGARKSCSGEQFPWINFAERFSDVSTNTARTTGRSTKREPRRPTARSDRNNNRGKPRPLLLSPHISRPPVFHSHGRRA